MSVLSDEYRVVSVGGRECIVSQTCRARHQQTPTRAPMTEKEVAMLPHTNTRLNLVVKSSSITE